jgi:hypothetical protein
MQRKREESVSAFVKTAPVIFNICRCMYIGLTYFRAYVCVVCAVCARTTLTGSPYIVGGKKCFVWCLRNEGRVLELLSPFFRTNENENS